MPEAIQLSIVIPAYNEAERLGATLDRIASWLDGEGLNAEVLVVDDGSSDGTRAFVEAYGEGDGRFRGLGYGENRGKGAAVAFGVAEAVGREILFSDADLSTPIEEYTQLHRALGDHHVAIGSRALPQSKLDKRQPLYREMMGRTFNLLVQALVFPGLQDTQCGFKLFRCEVAKELFELRKLDGFAFDVEVLYLARKRGYTVAELPVVWINDEASRVDPILDAIRMFRDILKIRRMHSGLEEPDAG